MKVVVILPVKDCSIVLLFYHQVHGTSAKETDPDASEVVGYCLKKMLLLLHG